MRRGRKQGRKEEKERTEDHADHADHACSSCRDQPPATNHEIVCVLQMWPTWPRHKVISDFLSKEYGPDYLNIKVGEVVMECEVGEDTHTLSGRKDGWIRVVSVDGVSGSGWVPAAFLRCYCISNLQSYQQLLDLFRQLLGSLVTVGHLLKADELKVSSCKNTASPFSRIENAGDNFLTRVEVGYATDVLEKLHMKVEKPLIEYCASFLHSNKGLGPFFADALGLLDHFTLGEGVCWNQENMAGTLEAICGGLEQKGLINVLKALVQYGITLLLAICENGGDFMDTMTTIMGFRIPNRCVEAKCGSGFGYIITQLIEPVELGLPE